MENTVLTPAEKEIAEAHIAHSNARSIGRATCFLFILFFLAVLYLVPVTQGIVEFTQSQKEHKKDPSKPINIQMLNVLEDSFITPLRNANTINANLVKTFAMCDQIESEIKRVYAADTNADQSKIAEMFDDQTFAISDAKKAAFTINRYVVADTTKKQFDVFDSVKASILDANRSVMAGDAKDIVLGKMNTVRTQIAQLQKEYPHRTIMSVPYLFAKVFRHIYWGDKYLRPYEKEMKDKSLFANNIRPQMLFMWYYTLQDLGDKAVLGKNGWLFYRPDVDYLARPWVNEKRCAQVDPNDKPIRDNPIDTIISFRDQLKKRGIELLVVIVPGKPSVYPDLLTDKMNPALSGSFSHSLRLMKELNARGIETVDLFGPFSQERKNDPTYGDSMYLQRDTHWKARGLRLAAHLVAERIKQYAWYAEDSLNRVNYEIDSVIVDRVGDIGTMTTLPNLKIHGLRMGFEVEKTKCFQVYKVERDQTGEIVNRELYKDDFRSSKVLLLGDSFSRIYQTDEPTSAGWISHIAAEIKHPLATVVSDGGSSTLVRERLARKVGLLRGKKLVVWEFVERDVRYGDEGWKDIKLASKTE